MGSITLTVSTAAKTITKDLQLSDANIDRIVAWARATYPVRTDAALPISPSTAIRRWLRNVVDGAAESAVRREQAIAATPPIDITDTDPTP